MRSRCLCSPSIVFVTDKVLNNFCKNEAMLIHFLPIWFGDVIDTGYGKFSRRGFFFSYSSIIDDDEDKGRRRRRERDEEASSSYIIISHSTTGL